MDINKRIEEILNLKNISYYKLAKLSGLSSSTLSNLKNRGNTPSVYTLGQICTGLEISLSQFFMDSTEGLYPLTEFQANFMKKFILLTTEQQNLLSQLTSELLGRMIEQKP